MNNKILKKVISVIILCSMLTYTIPVFAYTKDETVYTKIDKNGGNYKTIVSTHILNSDNLELIEDITDLKNIENTNGEEEYTQNGNSIIWKSNGKDIYYQGEAEKQLPIMCKVSYKLNGEDILPDDIIGKTGKVEIKLEYTNNEKRIVKLNGKNVEMYVPFVAIAGTIINNENNKNIQITNGKIIDDGSKTMVMGIAMPGMQESLGLKKDEVNIPSEIIIKMDTTDFEQNNIITYVTPKVLEEEDIKIFDKLDEIYSKVNTIRSSSKQIEEGADTLKEGTNTYSQKSKEFNNAMNKVSDGVSTVNSNYSKIDDGITSIKAGTNDLSSGATKLNGGISQLSSELSAMPENVEKLYNGTLQVVNGLNTNKQTGKVGMVDGVNNVLATLETTTNGLESALDQASCGSENAIKILMSNNTALTAAITALDDKTGNNDLTIKNLKAQISANNLAIESYKSAKIEAENKKTYVEKQYLANASSLSELRNGMSTMQGAMNKINLGLGQLNEASKKLPNALNELNIGTQALVSGTNKLQTGATTLNKGSKELKTGISTLDTSTKQLTSANNQLLEGAETLNEGAETLSDGIQKFNQEAIEKICNYINSDIKNISLRTEKLVDLSKEYNNYTMINEKNKGNVKFIMIIDALKKQENIEQNKEKAILNDNKK